MNESTGSGLGKSSPAVSAPPLAVKSGIHFHAGTGGSVPPQCGGMATARSSPSGEGVLVECGSCPGLSVMRPSLGKQ